MYTVQLTVDGKVSTAPLKIKMDPRVKATLPELQTLFAIENELSQRFSKGSEATLEAHSVQEQVEKLSKGASGDVKESLEKTAIAVKEVLSGREKAAGGEEMPGLDDAVGEVGGLYAQVGQSDAAPTVAQEKASAHAEEELAEALKGWEKVKASLPALNAKLRASGMSALDMEKRPETMPEGGDED
jgi:hypothetical protein